jgi:hypothetical protein
MCYLWPKQVHTAQWCSLLNITKMILLLDDVIKSALAIKKREGIFKLVTSASLGVVLSRLSGQKVLHLIQIPTLTHKFLCNEFIWKKDGHA